MDLLYLRWRDPRFNDLPSEWMNDIKMFLTSVLGRSQRLSIEFTKRIFSPIADTSTALSPSKSSSSSSGQLHYYPLRSTADSLLVASVAAHASVRSKLKSYPEYEGVKKRMGEGGVWPLDEEGAVGAKWRKMLRKGVHVGGSGGGKGVNLGDIDEGEEEESD